MYEVWTQMEIKAGAHRMPKMWSPLYKMDKL